jgi:hypothetical protein
MKKVVVKRKKAFIGAAIGAVTGIAGSLIGGAKKRKQERAMLKQQQEEQNKTETYQNAQALSSGVADQSYVEDYQKKVTLKMGGYADRTKSKKKIVNRIYRCGGRKKAELGTDTGSKWTKQDTGDLITGLSTGIQNGLSIAAGTPINTVPQFTPSNAKTLQNNQLAQEAKNKRIVDSNTVQPNAGNKYPTASTARFGTRRKAAIGAEIGAAAGGVGSLVGSLFQSTAAPKQVKKAVGFSSSAPKVGIQKPDYQQNAGNGEQIVDGNIVNPANSTNDVYKNRIDTYRCGGRKRVKRK